MAEERITINVRITMNYNYLLYPTWRQRREEEKKKKVEKIIAKNFPNLMKNRMPQIPEIRKHKKNNTYAHCQTVKAKGIKENLESSKVKMIRNNTINNLFLMETMKTKMQCGIKYAKY